MHATPVMRYRMAIARFLALDLIAGGLLLFLAALRDRHLVPGAGRGCSRWSAPSRRWASSAYVGALRFRRVSEGAQLHRTAEAAAALFNVPYVVFGHSHGAGNLAAPQRRTYVTSALGSRGPSPPYFVYFGMEETDGSASPACGAGQGAARARAV